MGQDREVQGRPRAGSSILTKPVCLLFCSAFQRGELLLIRFHLSLAQCARSWDLGAAQDAPTLGVWGRELALGSATVCEQSPETGAMGYTRSCPRECSIRG